MVLSLPGETLSGEDPEHPLGAERSGELPRSAAVLAQMRSENFPVASRVLPGGVRRHLHALYGYFRLVDYAGDEAPGNRDALLDFLEHDLERAYLGTARTTIMRELQPTVTECAIPMSTLAKLIEANRRDQHVKRYEDFDELMNYCALSANPVGESVLHVFGRAEEGLIALSDKVCSALQVLEHLQDLAEDHRSGRVYVPAEDLERYGCHESDLAAPRASTALRGLVRFEVARARRMLRDGSVLVGALSGTARLAVAGYVAGGLATVAAFEAAGHDPLAAQVNPSKARTFTEWVRLHARGGTR
ncbi:squalene synthase HpnC [Saccharopolyspora rhizosphaerae]|uniref:Squalene synthase HpnC n=1 Tax=Saccharopolyspora rhizosphaerae TaxID=2492662 RepID=A0A426K0D1_9PSEU|nr:squalene synthase HpnC [Saccharopolyspora rhizosphaerae]RRO18896.1 squalene synthase HpnC [Saccharopolyspora rhizosphaerae]